MVKIRNSRGHATETSGVYAHIRVIPPLHSLSMMLLLLLLPSTSISPVVIAMVVIVIVVVAATPGVAVTLTSPTCPSSTALSCTTVTTL